jgi:hypothetical protein
MTFGNWLWPSRRRRIRRQDRRRKADAPGAFARAVAHPWAAHRDRTDAGHDFALGQMPVAHQPPAAVISEFVVMAAEQGGNLRLDGLRQQRSRPVAVDAPRRSRCSKRSKRSKHFIR